MAEKDSGATKSVDTWLASAIESADCAETTVLEVAQAVGLGEEESHQLGMAVREAMVNAVVHGNRYSAQKKVHFLIARTEDTLSITVADQGNGFDLTRVPDPLAEENLLRESGRGILLIQAFVDEFQVRRLSPSGTEVRMVKYLTRGGGRAPSS